MTFSSFQKYKLQFCFIYSNILNFLMFKSESIWSIDNWWAGSKIEQAHKNSKCSVWINFWDKDSYTKDSHTKKFIQVFQTSKCLNRSTSIES